MSPDGKTVAFTVERPDIENNTRPEQIYTVSVDGGTPVQITRDGNNQRPRWTPDGQRLVFVSSRSGSNQIWSMKPDGSDPKQITVLAGDAGGVMVSPNGKNVLFTSGVYPGCPDDACNKTKLEADMRVADLLLEDANGGALLWADYDNDGDSDFSSPTTTSCAAATWPRPRSKVRSSTAMRGLAFHPHRRPRLQRYRLCGRISRGGRC